MAHIVLARKYRSQNFTDLIGQDVLVRTLSHSIAREKLAHGYILTGIRGVGKTSTARIFAKALNCLGADGTNTQPTVSPCGVCENCRAITESRHMDVVELDAASHTGVDMMRSILEEAAYRPVSARYKVYIIDEVHMLSTSAFNAMLKTLEEPPAHVIFILATTDIHKVPVTILSRCQRFSLPRVSVDVLQKHYVSICEKEGVEIEKQALVLVSQAADGSVRDGLSLLDQAISLSPSSVISTDLVLTMLGRTDFRTVSDLFEAMASGSVQGVLKITKEFIAQGGSAKSLLSDLLDFVYRLVQVKVSASSAMDLSANETEMSVLKKESEKLTFPALLRVWQLVLKGLEDLKGSSLSSAVLDMVCLRIMYLSQDVLPVLEEGEKTQRDFVDVCVGLKEENLEIKCLSDLSRALSEAKEILLKHTLETEAKIDSFELGKIDLFLANGRDFCLKLNVFLKEKTGVPWAINLVEQTNRGTVVEEALEEVKKNPLVSEALHLFGDGIIESVSEE